MNKIVIVLILIFNISSASDKYHYIEDGKFFTSKGLIPSGCFVNFLTQFNGDNVVSSVFLDYAGGNRGCIDANIPYLDGDNRVFYNIINNITETRYLIQVCEVVSGSIGANCSNVVIEFNEREYITDLNKKPIKVFSVDKIGEVYPTNE